MKNWFQSILSVSKTIVISVTVIIALIILVLGVLFGVLVS